MNNMCIVEYDRSHGKVLAKGINGIEIVRADKWLNHDGEENENTVSRFDENTNYLETNPQIAVIKHPNAKMKYSEGDRVFLHYMAWEWAELTEEGQHLIDIEQILFKILPDGTFELIDDLYLGEAVYSEEEVTPSGIIMLEGKKDNLKVKLTHVPPNNKELNVGDLVLSVDKNNYEFDYWGKKYVKLTKDEIVGVINGNVNLVLT